MTTVAPTPAPAASRAASASRLLRRAALPCALAAAVTLVAWRTGDWWVDGFPGKDRNLTVARVLLFSAVFAATLLVPAAWRRASRPARLAFLGWAAYLGAWLVGVWPGVLMSDSVEAVANARQGIVTEWFSRLHPLVHMSVLDVVPHVAAVAVLQVLVTAAVLACATEAVRTRSASRWPVLAFAVLAALSAPIVGNTVLVTRDAFFGVLHVLLALLVARAAVARAVTPGGLAAIALLTGGLSIYRGDGIVLSAVVPLVLLVALRPRARALAAGAAAFAGALLLFHVALPAAVVEREDDPHLYDLTLRMNPLGAVLRTDFATDDRARDLAELGRVIDVAAVRQKHTPEEIPAFWAGDWDEAATEEDWAAFRAASDRVLRRNLGTVIESRAQTFAAASALRPGQFNGVSGLSERVADRTSWVQDPTGLVAEPPVLRLYTPVTDVLRWTGRDAPTGNALHWNLVPWLAVLLVGLALVRRQPFAAVVALVVLSRVPLVFLAAPAAQYKYYYSVHLGGLVVLALLLAGLTHAARRREALA